VLQAQRAERPSVSLCRVCALEPRPAAGESAPRSRRSPTVRPVSGAAQLASGSRRVGPTRPSG